jgi:uracil-DNA glycosylase
VEILNERRSRLVFLLWGNYAQKKGAIVDRQRHCVLSAPHPSPLSAHRGFMGCGHFSQTNQYLEEHDQAPVNWFDVA